MQNCSWRISGKLTEQTVKHKTNLQIHGVSLYERVRAQYTVMNSLDGASIHPQNVKTETNTKTKNMFSPSLPEPTYYMAVGVKKHMTEFLPVLETELVPIKRKMYTSHPNMCYIHTMEHNTVIKYDFIDLYLAIVKCDQDLFGRLTLV